MADGRQSLESRVACLEEQLELLRKEVATLSSQRAVGAVSMVRKEPATPIAENEDASEELLSWVGQASLLPRISSLCFLLVVALGLRTVTDNEMLDAQIGSLIGMIYAGVLIAWGAQLYRKNSPLAPVLAVCGTLLMFSIVVETHAHFDSLPTVPAYLILTLAGAAAAAISYFFRVAMPVFAGTLGMSIAGLAIDYPNPIFPYLAVLLLAANLFGVFATRLQRCSWLRWLLFALTMVMLQVWSYKLGIFLKHQGGQEIPFAMAGFLSVAGIFATLYYLISLAGIVWKGQYRVAKFDLALPAITSTWIFIIVREVFIAGGGSEPVLGSIGLMAALCQFGVAHWLSHRKEERALGTNAFSLGGTILLVFCLPLAIGQDLVALTILSACALGLAWVAALWQSGGVRVNSYLLQLFACGALVFYLRATELTSPSLVSAVASGALAMVALFHFRWARTHAPPGSSLVFSRFDPDDRSAVLVLLAALTSGFFTIRVGIYQALRAFNIQEVGAFGCYQSVMINVSAIALMALAVSRNNKELRNVAVLVTIIGGSRVFFVDLFGARGLALVLSVLSFGVAAAVDSYLLSRWQKGDGGDTQQLPNGPGADPAALKEM